MKLLLCNAPDRNLERFPLWMPLGAAALAAEVGRRRGGAVDVRIVDCPALGWGVGELVGEAGRFGADVVGFSVMTLGLRGCAEAAAAVRRRLPGIVIVAGGPHVTGDAAGVLEAVPAIDAVLRGEADETLPELLEALEAGWRPGRDTEAPRIQGLVRRRADGVVGRDGADGVVGRDGADGVVGRDGADGVVGRDGEDGVVGRDGEDGVVGRDGADGVVGRDGEDEPDGETDRADEAPEAASPAWVKDLDKLPFPDWDLAEVRNYPTRTFFRADAGPAALVSPTRGCSDDCLFCPAGSSSGIPRRTRSVKNIIDEVRALYERYGIERIVFADEGIARNREYALELCAGLSSLYFKPAWSLLNGLRPDHLDPEIIDAMRASGNTMCHLGLETGSDRLRRAMGKGFTWKQAARTVRYAHKTPKIDAGPGRQKAAAGSITGKQNAESVRPAQKTPRIETGPDRPETASSGNNTGKQNAESAGLAQKTPRIETGGFFLLGLPGERTIDRVATIIRATLLPLDRAVFLPFAALPGSPLFRKAERLGYVPSWRKGRFLSPAGEGARLSAFLARHGSPAKKSKTAKPPTVRALGWWLRASYILFYVRPFRSLRLLREVRSGKGSGALSYVWSYFSRS